MQDKLSFKATPDESLSASILGSKFAQGSFESKVDQMIVKDFLNAGCVTDSGENYHRRPLFDICSQVDRLHEYPSSEEFYRKQKKDRFTRMNNEILEKNISSLNYWYNKQSLYEVLPPLTLEQSLWLKNEEISQIFNYHAH